MFQAMLVSEVSLPDQMKDQSDQKNDEVYAERIQLIGGQEGKGKGDGLLDGSAVGNQQSTSALGENQAQQKQNNVPIYLQNFMPSRPDLQMVPLNVLNGQLPAQPSAALVLSQDATVLREELMGYVDAIIERMDKGHALKKFESFQVETASRKTFRQLTEYFQRMDEENKKKAEKIQQTADFARKRVEVQDQIIKKLQVQVLEVNNINKKLATMEQKSDAITGNNNKKFDTVNEKINSVKVYLETKIEAALAIEERINFQQKDINSVQEVMFKTKDDIHKKLNEIVFEVEQYKAKHESHELRMDQTLTDSRFWLEKYTNAYRDNDKKLAELQSELRAKYETIDYQLSRRVTIEDMEKNFKRLNSVLEVKLRQIEDVREAMKDVINYQQNFYPMQMQAIIGENMMNLDSALNDQNFMQFQQKKYDQMINNLQKVQREAKNKPDQDLLKHLDELDEREVKSSGWTIKPLLDAKVDFVTDLVQKYLYDLERRKVANEERKAGAAKKLRRIVDMGDIEKLINLNFSKIAELKEAADTREELLEANRKKREHEQKIKKIVQSRMEFPKNKAFKRQNSYTPIGEEFGDIDDQEASRKFLGKIRTSVNHLQARLPFNVKIDDCMPHRQDKDLMVASLSISQLFESGGGGSKPRVGMRRRGGGGVNASGIQSGSQVLEMSVPSNALPNQVIVKEGIQFRVSPDGKKMIPIHTGATANNNTIAGVPGATTLDAGSKRKLIKELKEEIKPLISQICEFQIDKANQILKSKLRKIENDFKMEDQNLHNLLNSRYQNLQDTATENYDRLEQHFANQLRLMQIQRARDKSDLELKLNTHAKDLEKHQTNLDQHAVNFEAIAVVNSMLIESVCMQMEGEISDLMDRNLMALFGVTHDKIDKIDVQNPTKKLQDAKTRHLSRDKSPNDGFLKPAQSMQQDSMFSNTLSGDILHADAQGKLDVFNNVKDPKEILKNTKNLPITIQHDCLTCMQPGKDTQMILRLFKTACLSYKPSEVIYRDHKLTRNQLLGMRRDLIDKANEYMQDSGLHNKGSIYPRRYFDDLIVEQNLAQQEAQRREKMLSTSCDQDRLKELLTSKIPFGMPSPKHSSNAFLQSLVKKQSQTKQQLSLSRISPGDTTQFESVHQSSHFIPTPQLQATTGAQSARRNLAFGGLTLDTDSDMAASKLHIREKLLGNSTSRNIRNNTVDPTMQIDTSYVRRVHHSKNNISIGSARHIAANMKQSSFAGMVGGSEVKKSPFMEIREKPTLLVENSEAQLPNNLSLPAI